MALVIPGVSGSFVLLLLGVYPLATHSISSIRFLLADITNTDLLWSIGKVLVPLGIGVIIGGLSMARLIEKLLKNYYRVTYLIILGLLLGSVYALFKEPIVFRSGISAIIILIGFATFLLGCIVSFSLGRKRL
jgi:putative membrane protein